jgi:ferritin
MSATNEIAKHVSAEEDAQRCYRQLAAWADKGFRHRTVKYFQAQAEAHGKRVKHFSKYANDRGIDVTYLPLPAPSREYPPGADLTDWFAAALKLERSLLAALQTISSAAARENDWGSVKFLAKPVLKTIRQIAHLTRKVALTKEASGDAAALQAFDHNL